MIKRFIDLKKKITKGKVLIIYGPRQVGKTTILNDYLSKTNLKYKFVTGDNINIQRIFDGLEFDELINFASGYQLIAIDEAQQIRNLGQGIKIIIDNIKEISVIITGSSSLNITQLVGEPLTGRKRTVTLFPFSQGELLNKHNRYELKNELENYLIYGTYPEVINAKTREEKIEIVSELVSSYLLKDVFSIEQIKGSRQLLDMLKLIAFQVGSEVSINELATAVSMDSKTISRYLDILEKSFVIKKVIAYSKNQRKEITKKSKYYFLDNGIRNGIIKNFNRLSDRNDIGSLFENFYFMERIKYLSNNSMPNDIYFWRTYDMQEVDIVEDKNGIVTGYEVKWSEKGKYKIPKDWKLSYPESKIEMINRNNYLEYLL